MSNFLLCQAAAGNWQLVMWSCYVENGTHSAEGTCHCPFTKAEAGSNNSGWHLCVYSGQESWPSHERWKRCWRLAGDKQRHCAYFISKVCGWDQMAWWPEIKREKVPLKSKTPGAILSALKKLTTVGKQVTIKHKHRKMDSGHTRWWFVLRGEEEVLTQLEGELEHVRLQLQWNTQITSYHDLPRPSSIIQNTVTIWLEQQIHWTDYTSHTSNETFASLTSADDKSTYFSVTPCRTSYKLHTSYPWVVMFLTILK